MSPEPGGPPVADLSRALAGPPRALDLLEWARVLGGLRFVELALFESLGRAEPAGGSQADAVWASAASLGAAWRAEQLGRLLPVSVGLPDHRSVSRAPGGAETSLSRLAALPLADMCAQVASLWHPSLRGAYTDRARLASPASDGPFELTLRRLLADLEVARQRPYRRGDAPAPGGSS